jgi:hypothetical protein
MADRSVQAASRALVLLLLSGAASAADKYVAPSGGSDSGPGTFAQPDATIQHCGNQVADGETCWVRAGTYRPTTSIGIWNKAGRAGAPRRLAAYSGEKPIIDGTNTTGANSNAPLVIGSAHWVVEGLEFANTGTVGIQGWGASHLVIRNNVVHDCQGAGIALFWNGDRSAHTDNLVEGNVVQDCALSNSAHSAQAWPAGIAVERTLRTVLRNNVVSRVHGEGMLAYLSDQVTFSGNDVRDTYATCYYLDNTTNSTIERSFCLHTRNATFFDANPPNKLRPHNGVQIANETYDASNPSADNIIRNNIVVGAMNGFYYGSYQNGGGLRRTLVANNVFADLATAAVHIDADSHVGTVFVNNIFYQPGGGRLLDLEGSSSGLSGDHNVWFGAAVPAALAGVGDVTLDPAFANASARDEAGYRLASGSPAALTGRDLGAQVPDDFDGTARSAPYDIGAYVTREVVNGTGGSGGSGDATGGSGGAATGGTGGTGGSSGTGAAGGSGGTLTPGGAAGAAFSDYDATDGGGGCACRTTAHDTGRASSLLWSIAMGLVLMRRRLRVGRPHQA